MSNLSALASRLLGLAAVLALAGCSQDRTPTGPETVVRVSVVPATLDMEALGASDSLSAVAYSEGGTIIAGRRFSWRSEDPAVASVSTDGASGLGILATAVAEGSTRIVAAADGVEGASLIVVAQKVVAVTLTPLEATLDALGARVTFTALSEDARGNPVPGRSVAWSSSQLDVAAVDGEGNVTALAQGSTRISATIGDEAGSATVTVDQAVASVEVSPVQVVMTALGEEAHLSAVAVDPGGQQVPGSLFSWASSDTTVAKVDQGGVVVATGNGVARIAASAEGTSGHAVIEVRQKVTQIVLDPLSLSFDALKRTVAVAKKGYDAQGEEVVNPTYTWESSAPAVATVSATGEVTAVGNGNATITARADSAQASVAVSVVQRVDQVELSHESVKLTSLGATQKVTAVALDPGGSPVSGAGVTWSSSNPAIATVSADGLLRAIRNGTVTVSATSDRITHTLQVVVRQEVVRVEVTPGVSPLAPGNTVPLSARALDARGFDVAGATCAWSSSLPNVASVNGAGVVSAGILGTTTIACRSMEITGTATVNVVSSGWPNRPPGLTTVSDNPWNALASAGWDHVNRAAQSRIVSDVTAPLSQASVLEHFYPTGFPGSGVEPATDWIELNGASEFYIGAWFKASDPWQAHVSHINKIFFFFFTPDYASNVVFTMRGPPGGPYYLQPVAIQFPDPRSNVAYLDQNVAQVPLTTGAWHRIEIQFVLGTNGDGVIRWWQDGTLLGSYTDFSFPSGGFADIQISPTWGGVGGPSKAEDDYYRFDHVIVAKR